MIFFRILIFCLLPACSFSPPFTAEKKGELPDKSCEQIDNQRQSDKKCSGETKTGCCLTSKIKSSNTCTEKHPVPISPSKCNMDKNSSSFFNGKDKSANTKNSTNRTLLFENDYVKVWRTKIMPRLPLKLHRHDAAKIVFGIKGGTLKKIMEDGARSDLTFNTGMAYWMDKDPPNELHGDVNESDEPIEVLVIEMKFETKNQIM